MNIKKSKILKEDNFRHEIDKYARILKVMPSLLQQNMKMLFVLKFWESVDRPNTNSFNELSNKINNSMELNSELSEEEFLANIKDISKDVNELIRQFFEDTYNYAQDVNPESFNKSKKHKLMSIIESLDY